MSALPALPSDYDVGFNYAVLDPDVAAEARAVAERVRASHQRTVIAILEMGGDLLAVKARLGHGRFGQWLEAEFGGVARTAQNYMRAAQSLADKSEIVSHLPPATVYALAAPSTPGAVRSAILERLRRGERLHPDTITDAVRVGREAARAARGGSVRTPPKGPVAVQADESLDHVLAMSGIVTILRASLGDYREEFVELLREVDAGFRLSALADRL
jgi:DUF3102 family protein